MFFDLDVVFTMQKERQGLKMIFYSISIIILTTVLMNDIHDFSQLYCICPYDLEFLMCNRLTIFDARQACTMFPACTEKIFCYRIAGSEML